jgi:hypothetical protein
VLEYRAYVVGLDRHFVGSEPIICRNDAEAISMARRLLDGHDIGLWNGPRFVTRIKHEEK